MGSRAAKLLSTGAILTAAAAAWPAIGVLRADPRGVDARLLWVLVPFLSSAGVFASVHRSAWAPVWALTGTSCGFVVLASWSIGLFFAPSALLLFFAALAHLVSTRLTWRALLIPGWFIAGATTVCILFVLRDLQLLREGRTTEAPAIVAGAWISAGVWAFLALVTLLSWLHARDHTR
jgi:hypothetical protein